MSLNELTISEASASLRAKEIKATELTEACLSAIEAGNKALNAFLLVTADKAMEAAKESDKRLGAKSQPGVRALEGIPLGVKDSLLHQGRALDRMLAHPAQFRAHLRIDRHAEPLGRGRGHARQAQHGRVRDGLLQRDELFRAVRQPMARRGQHGEVRARRLVRRLGGGGRGRVLPGRHGIGYRRLDPPAGRVYRHGRHQAHLWPLLALGHDRLRVLARSGGAARPLGQGRGAAPANHGELRSEGLDQRQPARAGFREGAGLSR